MQLKVIWFREEDKWVCLAKEPMNNDDSDRIVNGLEDFILGKRKAVLLNHEVEFEVR